MNIGSSGTYSKEENNLPCCKGSWTDVSETVALIVFILNIVSPGFGLFVASFTARASASGSSSEASDRA